MWSRPLALLDSTFPDHCGREWHHVHRLCHSERIALRGHTDVVMSAAFSPDGARVDTASRDGTAKVWDSRPFRETRPRPRHVEIAPRPRTRH